MARSRNIKPGFFKNEILAECDPLARILFAGLWCEADREGRLEDRPKRLRADCLPYDEKADADALLNQLEQRGFIARYQANGVRYIAIPEFLKHQNPHVKEAASSIPAPEKNSSFQGQVIDSKESQKSTVLAPEIPERAGLIPSSLIPDPLTLVEACASPVGVAPERSDPIPYSAIMDSFNRLMEKLPKARVITTKRRTLIRSAWQASAEHRSADFWVAYFEECADDPFLNGTGPYGNGHANWRPDFEYLMRADVVVKVYEKAMDRLERAP